MTTTDNTQELNMKSIQEAAIVIRPFVHYTPMMTSSSLDKMYGMNFHFKCENLQKSGSFKMRGCMYSVQNVCKQIENPILVTHSSGNHAQAVAMCAQMLNLSAKIVMPKSSLKCKIEAVKSYGSEIQISEDSEEARQKATDTILSEKSPKAVLIHPFNNPDVMSGQGTVGLEMMTQSPQIDCIVVAVSGGGLAAGVTIAAKSLKPEVKVFAAEPEAADDLARSFAAKTRIPLSAPPKTIADGLRVSVGELPWPILRDNLTGVITVTEKEIVSAMYLCWERLKLVVEPSAAAAVSAAFKLPEIESAKGVKHVGVILCGGNVDFLTVPPKPLE